jgi:hypothetical protein
MTKWSTSTVLASYLNPLHPSITQHCWNSDENFDECNSYEVSKCGQIKVLISCLSAHEISRKVFQKVTTDGANGIPDQLMALVTSIQGESWESDTFSSLISQKPSLMEHCGLIYWKAG